MSYVEKVFDTGSVECRVFSHCLIKGVGEVSMVLRMTKEKYSLIEKELVALLEKEVKECSCGTNLDVMNMSEKNFLFCPKCQIVVGEVK